MRLPEKPPSDEEVSSVLAAPATKESMDAIKPYLLEVNSKYLHWNDILPRYKENLTRTNLRLLWGYTKLTRQAYARNVSFNDIILQYIQTPSIEKALHNIDMEIGGKIEIDEQVSSPSLRKKYLVSSLMEEAIASSQLEGAATTWAVAKQMLRENRKPHNKDEQMILNNYFTMKYIREHTPKGSVLDLDIIKEIHKLITKDTLEDKVLEGRFRIDNNIVVRDRETDAIIYTPPDFTLIEGYLKQLCTFANNEQMNYYLHPIIKAIILHYVIGYVHPFYDGNGRTARALFYWYLLSQDYGYLQYIAVSTAIKNAPVQYSMAYLYSESDHNDVTYFVKFNLNSLRIAMKSFKEYIERKRQESKRIIQTIKTNQNLNLRQADIIITMSKSEGRITLDEMKERYHTTYQTARTDLLELVELGYMHKIKVDKRFFFTLNKEKCLNV